MSPRISRGGVFSAPKRRDEVVLVTSQQAVALMGEQATETQITQPNAAAGEDSLYEGRTVHTGCGYDLGADAVDSVRHDVRAAQVNEALEGAVLEGIQQRYGYHFAKRTFDVVLSTLKIVLLVNEIRINITAFLQAPRPINHGFRVLKITQLNLIVESLCKGDFSMRILDFEFGQNDEGFSFIYKHVNALLKCFRHSRSCIALKAVAA